MPFIRRRHNIHRCHTPINWLGLRYGQGAIWECDKCKTRYLYSVHGMDFIWRKM